MDVNILITLTEAYEGQATEIFNMFLTVLFASFGFAAAMPLRDIGKKRVWLGFQFSSASALMGLALLAFYLISFREFYFAMTKANGLLLEIGAVMQEAGYSQKVLNILKPSANGSGQTSWPAVGYGVGAFAGLIVFMWLTNVKRPAKT